MTDPTPRLEALRALSEAADKADSECPVRNGRRLRADGTCPKCRASDRQPCGPASSAEYALAQWARSLSKSTRDTLLESGQETAERHFEPLEALIDRVGHHGDCAMETSLSIRCTCGLEDDVAAARASLSVALAHPDRALLARALEAADAALRNHACHGGEKVPCARTPDQCAYECGRQAGDALLLVEAALAASGGEG
jgi:hypothetical protein